MDEQLARKLLRNLRIVNTLIIIFSLVIIAVFAVAGILTYKVLTEVRNANDSFTSLKSEAEKNLDFKSQLCSSTGSLKTLLDKQSDVCD